MTPLLNIILVVIIAIIVVALSKVFEKKEKGLSNNFDDLFVEKQQALAGIVDEKMSEVKDNAIDLEIAVKRAGIISKAIEEDLAKLTPRIESYKDYEAAISQYQGQVEVLEDAYLEILNRVDTILKERHTIDKTYKRISDVKTKVLELESNVGLIQDNLVKSYRSKFDEFEGELYKRFDLLTSNLLARDAHYSSIAEQEKEKISELTEEFKNHVTKKEEMFTNQLTGLAERAARNNIEQLSGLFEKSREELFVRYGQFADEVNLKSIGIENRYDDLSKSGVTLEEELYDLRSSIRDRLNNITETSTLEFRTEMQKTKDTLLASLKEEVEKLGLERDEFLGSISEKACLLEKDLDSMKERSHKLDEDYIAKATEIETTFNELKTDINDRVSKEMVVFSDHIKDVLENENTGLITIYKQKTEELNELTEKIDNMSKDTLSKANTRFEDIIVEINSLRDDALIKAQDDLDNALDTTRTSIVHSINILNKDIENESNLLKEKIEETQFQTNEILSILDNKKDKILDDIKLEKEYIYKDLEVHSNGHLAKLEDEFNSMRATVCEDIDLYIEKTTKDILLAEEKMTKIENRFNSANEEIDKLLSDTEYNVKEKLEKKIDLLEAVTYELEKDVHDINAEFASKTMEAYSNIDTFKSEIESYGLDYIGQIKSELDNMFDSYKDVQVKEIVDDIDSVIDRIESTEKRCDDVQDMLSKNFTDLQSEMMNLLDDTKKESDSNKKSILDLLGTELKNATLDFDNMLNFKRDEMNILKGELEDVSHRALSGKEVFEKNMQHVYDIVEKKEKELLGNVEEKYSKLEGSLEDILKEKKEHINDLNSSYHSMFENASKNLMDQFSSLKTDAANLSTDYKEKLDSMGKRIESLNTDASNIKELIDSQFESTINIQNDFDNLETISKSLSKTTDDMFNKVNSLDSEIDSIKEGVNSKASDILMTLEDDVFKNITELRGLVDGAINRYKDEISEIEHHRTFETDSVIKEIKETLANQEEYIANNFVDEDKSNQIKIVIERLNNIENNFNNFSSNLETDNPDMSKEILEQIKLEISELDDSLHSYVDDKILKVEERVISISDKNDEGMEAITDKVSDIDNRVLAVDEKQEALEKHLIETMEERFNKVNEALNKSDANISNYKASMESLILDYEASLEEKISIIEKDINKISGEGSRVFENEINILKKYIEENRGKYDDKDVFEKINELRDNFISSIDKLESKTTLLTDEQNHLMNLLDVLRTDILESVKYSFDTKETDFNKKILSLKEEIVEFIPSMADIASIFETEKESMYQEFDKIREGLGENKKFEEMFEEEKNKLIEDLDKFKSIIRAENLGVDDKTSLLLNDIEKKYKDIINEEKKNWTEGFDSLIETIDSLNKKISNNDSVINNIVSEKVANEKALFEEKINSVLENVNKVSTEDVMDLISKEKEGILSNLEAFKEDITKTFSSVDDVSLLFAQEQNNLSEKFDSLKENILKDTPNLEDISKFLLEGEDKIQLQFDSFRKDIASKMPEIKEELQEKIDSIIEDFRDSVEEKKDMLENDLSSFKDTISIRIDSINQKTEELESDKEKILNDIEVLRYSIHDDKMSSEDVYAIIQKEKENILFGMEDFKNSILSLAKDQSSSLGLIEEEKNKLLDSIEALKNELSFDYFKKDEIFNFFKEQETSVDNIFNKLKKEILDNSPDLSSLADTFKSDVVSLFEESNNIFKDRIEKRVEHFEDAFSDPSKIKEFYRDAVTEEVLSLRDKTNSTLESLHEKMDNAREELEKIENEKIKDIVSRVDEARDNVAIFVQNVKTDIENQESEIKNIIEIQKEIKTEIDDIRKERQDLVKFIDNSEGDIKLQIDKLTDKIVVASDMAQKRMDEKETDLGAKVEETERYLLNIESKLTSAHQLHLEESRNKIDNLLTTFNDEVSREIIDLSPNMENLVNDFLKEELDSFKDFADAKVAVEKLESLLTQKIDDMFGITEDKLSENMKDITVRLSDYQNALLDEFNNALNAEALNSKEKMDSLQNDGLANLKVFYENSERSYSEKYNEKLDNLDNIFSGVEDEYKNKIETFKNEIEATKEYIVSSAEDTIADLKQALTLKEMFVDGIEENQKDMEKIEARIKAVESDIEPSIKKLEDIIKEKVDEIYIKMDEAQSKVEIGEKEFKDNLENINSKFLESFNERLKKVDDIIEDSSLKYNKSIDEVGSRVDAVLDEKSSQFDALKAHYEGMSESLEALRGSITDAINNRITEANVIIDEGMSGIESKSEERYEKYIERLNSNLEQTLSILMKDAKEYIHEAKESILKDSNNDLIETGEKLSDMTNIVSNLEKSLEEYGVKSEERLKALDLDVKDKTNILMNDLAKKTEDINTQVTSVIETIDTLSKDNKNNIESEYDSLKEKIDTIAYKVDAYLSDMKVFDNADAMTENIKNEIETLRTLLNETNEGKDDILETVSEFASLKEMHKEILEYAAHIKNEKSEIEDTENKIKMLIELSDDMKEKFTSISEYNTKIEKTESGLKAVLDLSNDIEDKLLSLKDKDTIIVDTLNDVETIEKQTFDIYEKINDIQHKLNDVEDNRNILMDKLQTVEQDAAKLSKNDKKIQTLISRIEQLEVLIDEIGNQRDNLMKMKTYYQDQDSKVENNLERADYAISSLESLLKNVDQYLFEDGIPLVKPTNKKVQYKGADSKKEKLIVDLYKIGWTVDQIVSHNNYSRDEVESIINNWKRKSSNNQ